MSQCFASLPLTTERLVTARDDTISPTGTVAECSPSLFPILSRTATNDTDITTSTRETFLDDDSEDDGDRGITAPISGTFEKHTFLGDLMKLSPKAMFDDRESYSAAAGLRTNDSVST
jgi:hypothetical protein